MKKGVKTWALIVVLVIIGSVFSGMVGAANTSANLTNNTTNTTEETLLLQESWIAQSSDLFKVTVGEYSETADLDQAIKNEYGDDYRLADWNDVLAYSNDIQSWASSIGMEHGDSYLISRDGNRFWSGRRHYFMTRHDHNCPGSFLVHDDIDNHFIDLGSWYNLEMHVLCIKTTTPTPPPSISLGDAVDNTDLSWYTSGGEYANWFGQTSTYYYDGDAAQSGDISDNQVTWMSTSVNGPQTVSFYWKVDSESDYDHLRFYIDGEEQDSISGSTSWMQAIFSIDPGLHTLLWEYTKDSSVSRGSDCGWVDKVEGQERSELITRGDLGDLFYYEIYGQTFPEINTRVNYEVKLMVKDDALNDHALWRGACYFAYPDDSVNIYPMSLSFKFNDHTWYPVNMARLIEKEEGTEESTYFITGLIGMATRIPGIDMLIRSLLPSLEIPPPPEGTVYYDDNSFDLAVVHFHEAAETVWDPALGMNAALRPSEGIHLIIPVEFTEAGGYTLYFFLEGKDPWEEDYESHQIMMGVYPRGAI